MAAPTVHVKLSKLERKIYKKQMKTRQTLLKHEGIYTSEIPTKILCISNAGLDNGVTQEEVRNICCQYGTVQEVIMLPQKPYCFVCFSEAHDCEANYNNINGLLFHKGQDTSQDVYFYASYVSQVPASVAPSSEMPPGLVLLTDFITPDCESCLLEAIAWEGGTSDAERTLKHRRVRHYGYEFKYSINNVDPNEPLPDGIPASCTEFLTRAIEMGVVKHFPDQLTVNQYEPGQGIPPHVDTPSAFEDGLMSLSLGSQVVMDFRHPDGRHLSVLLPRRSLVVMTGESRYVWSHGITPRKSDIVPCSGGLTLVNRETRTSFTFRKLTPLAGTDAESMKQPSTESPSLPETEAAALKLEQHHVHQVYEEIADHFSGTRHRAWPQIADFVQSQPTGTILADIGCGNGKYLGINSTIFELGSDRSMNLASICQDRNFPVFVGDILSIPLRSNTFDVCLCIAVIHHLSTPERRCRAVSELLRILHPGGQLLIYVWAMEQERQKTKSKYLMKSKINDRAENGGGNSESVSVSSSADKTITEGVRSDVSCGLDFGKRRSVDAVSDSRQSSHSVNKGQATDNETRSQHDKSENSSAVTSRNISPLSQNSEHDKSVKSEELQNDPTPDSSPREDVSCHEQSSIQHVNVASDFHSQCTMATGSRDRTCGSTSDKKLSIHVNRTSFKEQDLLVPWQLKNQKSKSEGIEKKPPTNPATFHRFYHVFTEGELEALCQTVGGSKIIKSYYDQGNWCVILEKL